MSIEDLSGNTFKIVRAYTPEHGPDFYIAHNQSSCIEFRSSTLFMVGEVVKVKRPAKELETDDHNMLYIGKNTIELVSELNR